MQNSNTTSPSFVKDSSIKANSFVFFSKLNDDVSIEQVSGHSLILVKGDIRVFLAVAYNLDASYELFYQIDGFEVEPVTQYISSKNYKSLIANTDYLLHNVVNFK